MMHALHNDVLKINETMLYAFCHVYAMMYEREMLLKCIFVWENKSLTTAREFWNLNPILSLEMKICVSSTMSRVLPLGIPVCCLRKLCGER